ncbi:MAG: PorP/SprF family type IX secretion system membrane protein [Chitinophagaceae bacterium]|nr:PorP/SprF family type IX secretion system membrane protein [Chitinophagaceae bacterium]
MNSQDLHFSQYFNAPLLVNPANTGFNPEYDFRIGGNYRNQWASVSNFPYKTMSVWGDAQLFTDRFEDSWVGIGGAFLQDVAGSGNLKSTRAYASIAYHQLLGFKSLLSGGFNLGFTQKRIDLTKLSFNSQWNGKFFDVSIPSGEPFAANNVNYFSLQAGLNYSYFASDNVYLNTGISMANINRPSESFFGTKTADNRVDSRYTFFANASIKLQDLWILNPNIHYSTVGNTNELVVGMMAQRDLSAERNGSLQLLAGAYYRSNDAFIPMVGFDVLNLKITFNYDATVSSLSAYNQSRGAYEVSIVKSGLYKGREKNIKCPTPRF